MGMITVIITFIVPVLYIFGGIFLTFRAPSFRCRGPAYKSRRAALSPHTWHYANFNFGIVCIFMGIYILILTGLADAILWRIGLRTFEASIFCVIAVVLQLLMVFLPFYNTEQHLKDFYDEKGRPLFEEKKHRFLKRMNEEEWDDWSDPPEDGDDGWDDWKTWLRKRDIELDREREGKEAEDLQTSSETAEAGENDESFEEELEKLFEELESIDIAPEDSVELDLTEETAGTEGADSSLNEEVSKDVGSSEAEEENAESDGSVPSVETDETAEEAEK